MDDFWLRPESSEALPLTQPRLRKAWVRATEEHLGVRLPDEYVALLMEPGRVAPGGCPPGAPTDPDVQVSRIRFLK
jgi:hypothetical protein